MMPPDVKNEWDENSAWTQARLIAYEEIRQYEHNDELTIGMLKKGF